MIQITCCSYNQQKLRRNGVDFYSDNKFIKTLKEFLLHLVQNIHFLRTGLMNGLKVGRCNNCKIICFSLNFLAEKIKIGRISDVPAEIELKAIEEYLFGINSKTAGGSI